METDETAAVAATNTNDGLKSLSLYNIAFTVTDLDMSIQWYSDILNFTLVSRTAFSIGTGSAKVALLEGAGTLLELLQSPLQQRMEALFAPAPAHLIPIGMKAIVFQVNNLAETTRELEKKGVGFVWKEQYLAGDKMLSTMIEDVDGNKINIFQANTTYPQKA